MSKIESLSKSEIEKLVSQALTTREKNRIASKHARQQKMDHGLVQISMWLPKGSPDIARFREYSKKKCKDHIETKALRK